MSKIDIDVSELEKFRNKLSRVDIKEAIKSSTEELALRTLAKTKKKTPVGNYDKLNYTPLNITFYKRGNKKKNIKPGDVKNITKKKRKKPIKKGGTLRRSWHLSELTNSGKTFSIEIYNDAKNEYGIYYGPYVEYGHRKRGGTGWVRGHFMLTRSMKELKNNPPSSIINAINDEIKKVKE